ncbi:MAG: hypothetical protein M0R80_18355 [Proteobacteria bacterium]|jgi:hypothetical protein|nr:hypothetical protein [Pseudomonadota bacterium]
MANEQILTGIQQTDVADGIPVVVAGLTLKYLKNNTVMARLVRRDWDNEVASYGDTVRITKMTGLTVKTKSGGSQYEAQELNDAKVDVVLNQHKYVGFLIEDIAAFLAKPQYQEDLMNEGVSVIAEEIDGQLLALYSEATGDVGSAGVDATADILVDARKVLTDAKAPSANRYVVWSAKDAAALLKVEKFTNSQWVAGNGEALVEGSLGRKYGFDQFECQGVKETGEGSPISTHNIAFQKGAFALVTRPLRVPNPGTGTVGQVVNADGIGLRVMTSYQHKDGGYFTTIDVLFGVKTVRPELAVEVLT